jgi:hypothetical protein
MFKGKLAVLCLVAAALLVANSTAFAGIIDPCNSTCSVVLVGAPSTPVVLAACPQGDGGTIISQGWRLDLTIEDGVGNGIAGISPTDFWLDDQDPGVLLLDLCGGSASSGADSLTNASGQTTMSNTTMAASNTGAVGIGTVGNGGGAPECPNGVIVVVQGTIISTGCPTPVAVVHPVNVRSFDLNGDKVVNSLDLFAFAQDYPPNPFGSCTDYNHSGTGDLGDLTTFALHFGPPSHSCQ